jgi:hypothetical protein
MKTIYDMKLFEVIIINNVNILRVPGGWLITYIIYYDFPMSKNDGSWGTTVFVPFHNEFQL